ncbi:MAG TPA: hypothetical protein VNU66_00475 [Mycobacteriales bacterium]|nr:hypothetical protein [Mycobacteriales bacterium]
MLALAAAVLLVLPAQITESSGVASSSVSDEWLFTHEDSGADGEVHAVATDGRLLATYRLGVQSRDWEDMARAGRTLYLADIGDNSAARDLGLLVHEVPEPDVDPSREGVVEDLPPTASYRLRYPDGPRDAETLLVHPTTGRAYVVTKGILGRPQVWAAPLPLRPDAPNLLEQVGEVEPRRTGTPGGPGIGRAANVLVTAGDISPDGGRVALRTYTDLYEWRVQDGDVAGALEEDPVVLALPPTVQGEGLAYTRDGTALLTTTEGPGAEVHRVPSPLAAQGADPASAPAGGDGVPGPWRTAGVVAAAGVLLLTALLLRRRPRR